MDGEDDYDNYFDDDWTWNSDRKPGLGAFHFVIEAKQGSVLSVVLFSFTEECKQISDVTNLKKLSAMGLNFNLITEPPQVSVLFSQCLMAMGW